MKIAIAGAGMCGSYLYRRLIDRGCEIDLFDAPKSTKCGISPCAWGTSNGFHELVKAAGLDPEEYILENPGYIMMDEVTVTADLMTFDKPRLINDLLCDASIKPSILNIEEYDRIIDATGFARVYLPQIENDVTLECVQYKIRNKEPLENCTKLGNIGYAWTFPLSDELYHVGCGSFTAKPLKMLHELGWVENCEVVCSCGSRIRLTAPKGSLPFVHGNTWGIGEAIGMVSPMAGDGIVPGMLSAQILLQNWNDPEAYTRAILSEFAWMEDERLVIDKLRQGKPLGVSDALVLKKNSQRMGMKIGLKDAAMLLKRLL